MSKILIVDDALFMRARIKKILEDTGYELLEAADGKEGCAMFEKEHPDLVLLDISMPVMNGIDALNYMIQSNPSIPIIMCSAIGQESQILEAIQLGAKQFITKPFNDKLLIKAIQSYLEPSGGAAHAE